MTAGGTTSLVVAVETLDAGWQPPAAADETIVLALDVAGVPQGCVAFDLLARQVHGAGSRVVDSVREFCRKRGIRFEPGPWRYSGGLV